MTNAEHIEEMFFNAYRCGAFYVLHDKVSEIQEKQKTPFVTTVPLVYQELKTAGIIVED